MTDNKTKDTKEIKKFTEEEMFTKMQKMSEQIAILEKAANKTRMAKLKEDEDASETIIRVRAIDGKVITSWETLSNTVYRDPKTKLIVEDQKIKVNFNDGSKEEMEVLTFNRKYKHVECVLVEATDLKKEEDIKKYGIQKFKLETKDGKEYTIGSNFVN